MNKLCVWKYFKGQDYAIIMKYACIISSYPENISVDKHMNNLASFKYKLKSGLHTKGKVILFARFSKLLAIQKIKSVGQ